MSATASARRTRIFVGSALAGALVLGGCGSSSKSTGAIAGPKVSGPVDVAYAASLQKLFTATLAPMFERASGAAFNGYPAGSDALASAIAGKTRVEDVFLSASPKTNAKLMGPAHGDWVSWYASLARAPLVLGYDPTSKFAAALLAKPWYQVVTQPGFLLGRTDPAIDPKGKLSLEALDMAATSTSTPALGAIATSTAGVFPEEALVGRLQSGQLDAGFFYANEAKAANIPTVPLTPVALAATYTVTVLNRAPDPAAAAAFVAYLYSAAGRAILAGAGLTLPAKPEVTGPPASVPASLHAPLGLPG